MSVILLLLLIVGLCLAAGLIATTVIAARAEAAHPPAGRFVPVEGGRLHVIEAGPKDRPAAGTVVLLHGACGNAADMMLTLGAGLAARYRVLAFDRPGHGWSDRPGGRADASPARQALLIRQALEALAVDEAVIVGHSWSGAPTTLLALDHDDVVIGVMLLGAVTHPWPGGVMWYYTAAARVWLAPLFAGAIAAPIGRMMMAGCAKGVFAPEPEIADYTKRTGAALLFAPRRFRANAEDVAGLHAAVTEQSRRYRAIRVPLVVMHGEDDRVVHVDMHARRIAREAPGAKLVVLKGVGHMPHHTQAARIIAEIDEMNRTPALLAAE